MQAYVGSICVFPFNFAPVQWSTCGGQSLAIRQYTALFSLIGTTFGGDGTTTFNLPNMHGRTVVGAANTYPLGSTGGVETVALNSNNIPAHTHSLSVQLQLARSGSSSDPTNNFPVILDGVNAYNAAQGSKAVNMAPATVTIQPATGGSTAINTQSPYLGMLYCIALQGIFPQRS